MKYKKGMRIKTLEDCELPHDMRAEEFTLVEVCYGEYDGLLKVKDSKDRFEYIDRCRTHTRDFSHELVRQTTYVI